MLEIFLFDLIFSLESFLVLNSHFTLFLFAHKKKTLKGFHSGCIAFLFFRVSLYHFSHDENRGKSLCLVFVSPWKSWNRAPTQRRKVQEMCHIGVPWNFPSEWFSIENVCLVRNAIDLGGSKLCWRGLKVKGDFTYILYFLYLLAWYTGITFCIMGPLSLERNLLVSKREHGNHK